MTQYVLNVLVAADALLNTILGGLPDETISARAARAQQAGRRWGCILCRLLDRLEQDHCALSLKGDAARAEALEDDLGVSE